MLIKKLLYRLFYFLDSPKEYPVLAALFSGLYPLMFYYTNNFTLINTWKHFGYFSALFLGLPLVVILLTHKLSNLAIFRKWKHYVIPFLNLFFFLFFLKIALYAGFRLKITLLLGIIAMVYAFLFYKHYKKVLVFQILLCMIGVFTTTNTLIRQLGFSEEWKKQPDDIENVLFTTKPNIYFIQPDGMVNFSELRKGYYQYQDTVFESSIKGLGFKNYPNFRSNYASTLSTNSATFMMKHHYYNKGLSFSETIDARDVIVSDNSVLHILKNNGYKTHLITEAPYFLMNRPEMGYDYSNFTYKEFGYITSGFNVKKNVLDSLTLRLEDLNNQPNFFFIEFFNPGHIHNHEKTSLGREEERRLWIESLQRAENTVLTITNAILEKDPNALIIVMADHGGFVGMDFSGETYNLTKDRDLIYSIFSSQLSIHWPYKNPPDFDGNLKTPVNLFRILFAYLGENSKYLNTLEPNESFVIIRKGAPKGIYQYLNEEGAVAIKKW